MTTATTKFFCLPLLLITLAAKPQCISHSAGAGSFGYLPGQDLDSYAPVDGQIAGAVRLIVAHYGITAHVWYRPGLDNAFASSADGGIILGTTLVDRLRNQQGGMRKVLFVLAHELSHLYQYATDLEHNSFYSDASRYNSFELQADYMAGYVLCHTNLVGKDMFQAVYEAAEQLGDYGFFDITHHGTPSQRSYVIGYGAFDCAITDPSSVLQRSYYHVNPSNRIKSFNELNILGEFHLYTRGRNRFDGAEQLYLNYDNEVFLKKYNAYLKIGAAKPLEEYRSAVKLDLFYDGQAIALVKKDNGVLYDDGNLSMGEFIFYEKYFSRGRSPDLSVSETNRSVVDVGILYGPTICQKNGLLYVAYISLDSKLTLLSSSDGVHFAYLLQQPVQGVNGPQLASDGNFLYLGWVSANHQINLMAGPDGQSWTYNYSLSNEPCYNQIAMAAYNGKLYLGYSPGGDGFRLLSFSDGKFTVETQLGILGFSNPSLYVCSEDLCLGWIDSRTQHFNTMQSGYDIQFFNGLERSMTVYDHNVVAGDEHQVPQLGLTEQWWVWSAGNDKIAFTTVLTADKVYSFSESNRGEVGFSYPYMAWSGYEYPHKLVVIQIGR